jgi:tRNA dimethylallyltransferase
MRDPIYIAGPTASGKSAVALLLAERLGGEIISVDSMQVYRGMDIGTAKPTSAERSLVPHHLIDVMALDEPFDVARFVDLARAAESQIQSRGRVPIYCGGTGLYLKALVGGLGASPPSNPAVRAELEGMPLPDLLRELEQRDPETYGRIDRSNPRRIIRAIEVIRLTGEKFSSQRAAWRTELPPGCWIGLERDRADLVARINQRVDQMFAAGLMEETRSLLATGLERNRTAMQSLGYKQVVEHLRGERSLSETIELVKQKTRQFAKRQMTWFRHQLTLRWVRLEAAQSETETADAIYRLIVAPK